MKILNYGSLNLDYVYQVDHMVRPGETEESEGRLVFCGGKGLNQSVALARAGAAVYHAGLIGPEGKSLIQMLESAGVKTKWIAEVSEPVGHTVIQVDSIGQNSILLYGGANRKQTKHRIDKILSCFQAGDILVLQNEINELSYLIEKGYERQMKIVLNPSPWSEQLRACDFAKVSLLICNEIESRAITEMEDPKAILDREGETVLTLGEKGAWYRDAAGNRYFQPAFSVCTVDTTGAGDTFTGYFVENWSRGLAPSLCLETAAKAAALSVSRPGAAPSIPAMEEVQAWR